jgi:O-antigen/teichoic acid export membrane protein
VSAPVRTHASGPSSSEEEGTTSRPENGGADFQAFPREEGSGWLSRWIRIFAAYFSTQTLTQLLGVVAGLLFVNLMPVRELALYTLAFSVVSFFNFLSDLGSTSSLLHFFHRTGQDRDVFEPYLAAVLSLRRAAFLLGAGAVAVAFPLAARARGFGWGEIPLVTAGVLACVWFQIQASIRTLALRLHDRYARSYRADVGGALLRLLGAGVMAITGELAAWLGVAASAAASALSAAIARPERPPAVPAEGLSRYRHQILRYLLPTLPSALFFSVQSPLTVWLSATFGSTRTVAEVGALGRLGLIVGLFSGLTGIVFLPRLARTADDRLYRRRAVQYGLLLAVVAAALLTAAALLPQAFLLLLGPHYRGLQNELLLIVAGSGLALLGSYASSVNLARGWTRFQGLTVLGELIGQILLVKFLTLSTTAGVLRFTLLSAATGLLGQCVILWLGFTRPSRVHWREA